MSERIMGAGFVLGGFNEALGKSNTLDELDEHTRRVFATVGGHVLERILERVGAPMRDISNHETKA